MAGYHPLLSTQLLDKLQNEEEELSEKCKLAEFTFTSSTLPVLHKEEIILEWLAKTIMSYEDNNCPKEIFTTLLACVKSQHFQNFNSELRQSVSDCLLSALSFVPNLSDIETRDCGKECIIGFLEAPLFQNFLCRDINGLCGVVKHYCSSPCTSVGFIKLVQLLISISKLSLLQNELRLGFCKEMLLCLCQAYSTIEVKTDECENELYNSIEQILFRDNSITEKFLEFYPLKTVDENCCVIVLVNLLKRLPKTETANVVEICYLLFLKAVFSNNKNNHSQVFKVFTNLSHALGVKVKGMISIEVRPKKKWTKEDSFMIMSKMVDLLDKLKMSIDCQLDDETSLSVWFTSMIIGLTNIHCGELSPQLLRLIGNVIRFNPLIIVNSHKPLTMIMLERKESDQLMREYCSLLMDVLDGSNKVSRLQKFISMFLETLEELLQFGTHSLLQIEHVFPKEIVDSFSESISNLPSPQVLSATKALQIQLLFRLNNLARSGSTYDPEVIIGLEIVIELLALFINGVKVVDFNTPIVIKDKYASIVSQIEECITKFGETMLERDNNDRVLISFLKLCNAIGNYLLLTWEYDKERNRPLTVADNVAVNICFVHSYLDPESWEKIAKCVDETENSEVKDRFYSLLMQKMAAVSQVEEGCEGPGTHVARYLLEHANAGWHWEHAGTLAPLLQDNELLGLVEGLTKSAGRDHTQWLPFVSSHAFLHDKRLVVATSIAILTCVAKHIHKNRKNGAISHKVMSEVAIVPLLEYELSRLHEDNRELESELTCFFDEILGELDAYLLSDPSPAPTNEDFSMGGFIEIITKISYEGCSYPMEACVLIGIIALLCDIPVNTNNDHLLLKKLNCFLGEPNMAFPPPAKFWYPSFLHRLNSGALLNFLIKRTASFEDQKLLIGRLCSFFISGSIKNRYLIKSVKSPSASTMWQTISVIKALAQSRKRCSSEVAKENTKCIVKLVNACVPIFMKETPRIELLQDYSVALKHILASNTDSEDTNSRGLLINFDQYLNLAISNFIEGRPLLKFTMKRTEKLSQHIPQDFLVNLWNKTLMEVNEQDCGILHNFFSVISADQMKTVLSDLNSLLERSLAEDPVDIKGIERCFYLWEGLLNSDLSSEKNRLRMGALLPLLKPTATLVSTWKGPSPVAVIPLLNFFTVLGHHTSVALVSQVLDSIFISLDCVPLDGLSNLDYLSEGLNVLFSLYIFRKSLLSDRLPAFLQRFKLYSEALAKLALPSVDFSDLKKLEACAIKLAKGAQNMIKNKKDFGRIAPYIISDVLHIFELQTMHSDIKVHFVSMLNCFFSICDEHATSYLSSTLRPSLQELYKTYYEQYNKYYRYHGKI